MYYHSSLIDTLNSLAENGEKRTNNASIWVQFLRGGGERIPQDPLSESDTGPAVPYFLVSGYSQNPS